MRDALKEHSVATRELLAALGDLRVAESRIAHPDQTLVSDVEQLRTVRREQALATQRLEQLIDAERRAIERGAALAAVLGTDDPERLAEELEAAQRRDAQATAAGSAPASYGPGRRLPPRERARSATASRSSRASFAAHRRRTTRATAWSGCTLPRLVALRRISASAA